MAFPGRAGHRHEKAVPPGAIARHSRAAQEGLLPSQTHHIWRTAIFTVLALLAFAANSVLCRLALGAGAIDAGSFTVIRLVSGIAMLWILVRFSGNADKAAPGGSVRAASMLFLYAIAFSFAYLSLDAGTGALILFGAVQVTMVLATLWAGVRLGLMEWGGLVAALGGLAYLMLPGATAPSLTGFLLMAVAGMAWAAYTLMGRGSANPLGDTFGNFLKSGPLALLVLVAVLTLGEARIDPMGAVYAVLSGAIASGVGYALWYAALRELTALQAGVLQLSVPIIAAFGGIVFIAEPVTPRLIGASTLILGGILAVLLSRHRVEQRPS